MGTGQSEDYKRRIATKSYSKPIQKWNLEEVQVWLTFSHRGDGISQLAPAFMKYNIDGAQLAALDKESVRKYCPNNMDEKQMDDLVKEFIGQRECKEMLIDNARKSGFRQNFEKIGRQERVMRRQKIIGDFMSRFSC